MESIMELSQSELNRIVRWFSLAEFEGAQTLEDYELAWKIAREIVDDEQLARTLLAIS